MSYGAKKLVLKPETYNDCVKLVEGHAVTAVWNEGDPYIDLRVTANDTVVRVVIGDTIIHDEIDNSFAVERRMCFGIWKHEKTGGLYRVVCGACLEKDKSNVVVYRSLSTGYDWVRTASEFLDGRFTLVKEESRPSDVVKQMIDSHYAEWCQLKAEAGEAFDPGSRDARAYKMILIDKIGVVAALGVVSDKVLAGYHKEVMAWN